MKWVTKTLGDVCEFQRGLTYAKSDEAASSSNVVLRANNIDLATNLLDFSELRYIRDSFDVPASKRTKQGSLLICTASGSKSHLGKIAYIDNDHDYAFGGFMGMLTPAGEISPRYLFHLMTSDAYKDFIDALADGANINNLKFDDLRRFPIPLPPLPEQHRIVAILDNAFAAIATAKANAEKNLHNAHAVFENHLNAVLSTQGDGWTEKRMIDVCSLFFDSAHRTPKYQEEGFAALRPRDVVNGAIDLVGAAKVSHSEYRIQTTRYQPQPGDIVYSRELSLGWAAIVPDSATLCLSQGMCVFRPNDDLEAAYLVFVLNSPFGRAQALSAAVGTAHPHINLGNIRSYRIPIPPRQSRAKVVDTMRELQRDSQRLQTLYQQKFAALDALKKSLLHHAFTGAL